MNPKCPSRSIEIVLCKDRTIHLNSKLKQLLLSNGLENKVDYYVKCEHYNNYVIYYYESTFWSELKYNDFNSGKQWLTDFALN